MQGRRAKAAQAATSSCRKVLLAKALTESKLASSGSDARRLMTEGGVKVNGEKATDPRAELAAGEYVVQVRKLKAAKLKVS